ncbi:MAG: tRNA (guanine(26)-N(2))-dimethyltransferase [Nanoarchaeota archaeon]|nr:tRNA (guanine(26)-N(2))-dimethyltransferase [Nanoarchaeota archaeon]
MQKDVTEGEAVVTIFEQEKISKELPVFYNPIMKMNRDISILLLNALDKKGMVIADSLAGSGVRAIRFLKELNKDIIKDLHINDYSEAAVGLIKKNLLQNNLKDDERVCLSCEDVNLFMIKSRGFHYIDIDPFGSPNSFLDCALKKIAREGILAVTATDTSALCGTYPKACRRKYWAEPKRDELMHETGIRILIRKVQLIGAQYDKAMTPVFSYSKDHYMRIFFMCRKGKSHVDAMQKLHMIFNCCGPLWTGQLWDSKLAKEIMESNKDDKLSKFLEVIYEESKIRTVGFYQLHAFCKLHKLKIKKTCVIKDAIIKKGFRVSDTHFSPYGIRSDIGEGELRELITNL